MVSTAPVTIQDMTLDDVDGVQEVERASFPVPWPANAFRHELTQNKNARYIVARDGDRIVAYAGLWLMVDEAHITTFAVHPDARRRRIGERLLQRLFEIVTEDRTLKRVFVACGGNDAEAGEFMERIRPLMPHTEFHLAQIGPVVGVHAGPNVLGVALLGRE